MDRSQVPEHLRPANGPTEPQLKYIKSLLEERDLGASPIHRDAVEGMSDEDMKVYVEGLKVKAETLSKGIASKWIQRLLELPKLEVRPLPRTPPVDIIKGRTRVEYETFTGDDGRERKVGKIILPDGRAVLEGSYGIDTEDDERFTNKVSFFRVWIAEGYGKGWGVKMYTSDYTHRVNLAVPTQVDVIVWIADDPLGGAKMFGHEFKRCGICYRGLTKDESRAAGIGPVCGARIGIKVY